MEITYVTGDATKPKRNGDTPIIIPHIVNDIGAWGKGFVLALSKRWPQPETAYRNWYKNGSTYDSFGRKAPFKLGQVQFVDVGSGITVANIVGQRGIGTAMDGVPPIRYDALREGLETVGYEAPYMGAEVHMPPIGTGLAGGDWPRIEKLINEEIAGWGIKVVVYELT